MEDIMFRHEERKIAENKEEGKKENYLRFVYMLSFTITLTISTLFIINSEKNNLIVRRAHVSRMIDTYVRDIENIINSNVAVNYSLNMLIHEGEQGQIDDFDELGKQVLSLYPNIKNISLAPNGVVQQIYPYEENRSAIGHDLFSDKDRITESILTRELGVLNQGCLRYQDHIN